MLNIVKKIVAPNVRRRRIMAGICAAFVLATFFFSSVLLAAEANHDCSGRDCPICLEVQNCVANFQLLGSALGGGAALVAPIAPLDFDACAVCSYRAPALTLQRLDVRFDE